MAFKKPFLVSDETKNCYGFIVRTAGIKLANAIKNCPCFYEHDRDDLPLGHWENFRVENNKLYADLVIDGVSEEEKTYIRKIENGDIKGATIGADTINWNYDGETPILTECDLFEISIAALPGNTNALALRNNGVTIKLSQDNKHLIIPPLKNDDMKAIALKLGLSETATENEILAAIGNIQLARTEGETFRTNVLDGAGETLKDEAKEIFVTLSKTNPAQALKYAASQKEPATEDVTTGKDGKGKVVKDVTLSALIQKAKLEKQTTDAEEDSFDYLQKHNSVELGRIRTEEPDKYAALVAEYGKGKRYTGK